jgi:hypothetical protein
MEDSSILGGKQCIASAENPMAEKVRRAKVHRSDDFTPSGGSS